MPNVCFIDTNVLLYAKDPDTPKKRAKAIEWLNALVDRRLTVVSPQVLNEFAHNVIKKLKHISPEALEQNLEAMIPWCTAPTSPATTLDALVIHRRFRFSFYDSTLVASALASRCDLFLSEDLGHDQRIFDMRIVNPFVTDPLPFLEQD